MTPERYRYQRYLLMTLDPVHPGAGGYRLGRVDNSIAREPGTRLPKIPGSSLHGAARSYAAYLYEKPQCAGQGQSGSSQHCGKPDCPICYTFGYIKGKAMSSGVVNVFDAQLLLFPVHSMLGPVWVSTPSRLRQVRFENLPNDELSETACWTTLPSTPERLNLGWMMLDARKQDDAPSAPSDWEGSKAWDAIKGRLVLVSDSLFPHIVNSNLEVRTSVAIDPGTGAAEEGALYTYEAIPRAAFLTADVVLDDYNADKNDRRPAFPITQTGNREPKNLPGGEWKGPLDVVRAGLRMMQCLGVGGMGTRGFGRIEIIGNPVEKTQEDIFQSLAEQEAGA